MNFLFVCGGTAGHINPALAIANRLRQQLPDAKIVFIGSGRDHEKRLIPKAGFELRNIRMSGLSRKLSPEGMIHNIKTVRNVAAAGNEAVRILNELKPDVVIGTGGYICYPVLSKASQMRIPTVIHESNAIPGLTSKLLSASVTKMLVSFPGLEKQYRKPERVVFTGTPVRMEFIDPSDSCTFCNTAGPDIGITDIITGRDSNNMAKTTAQNKDRRASVVSFWGSLGADKMNDLMADFIKRNAKENLFDHIHATGKNSEALFSKLEQSGLSDNLPEWIDIREYIDDMPIVMRTSDVVLCRAGASTVAELTVMGKPAILVPSPYVTHNHQEENAKQLSIAGGAIVVREKSCTGDMLFEIVCTLLEDRDKLKRMAYAQKSIAAPEAAEKICGIIISLAKDGESK